MITLEQVEKLTEVTGVSYNEAKEVLEQTQGDLLEAVLLLEREGKVKSPSNDGFTTSQKQVEKPKKQPNSKIAASSISKIDKNLVKLMKESIDEISDENGWAFLGTLGSYIIKKKTDFDPRNYGFLKLYPLIKKIGQFEIEEKETGKNNIRHIYIKNK